MDLLHKVDYGMEKVALVINGVDNKRMGIQPEAIERAMMPALAQSLWMNVRLYGRLTLVNLF